MEKWFMIEKGGDFDQIGAQYGISPVLARLLCNRGVTPGMEMTDYLTGDMKSLGDGRRMQDMDRAVRLLTDAIKAKSHIRIIGDYDIDGVNATYILYEGLRRLGACVDADIPERIKDGYGISRGLIDRCIEDRVELILTCDNGIAAADEVAYAASKGMTVIVTDHHQIPFEEMDGQRRYHLPPAQAVLNPHRPDCAYPFKDLCGAAVAFVLIRTMAASMGQDGMADDLLEHAAIATIGDVMDLIGENRIIAREGLRRLPETKNTGLRALIEAAGLSGRLLSAYHIGFVIGPCINAGGRLDTALRVFDLFRERDEEKARMMAQELVDLNDARKNMTLQAVKEGMRLIEDGDRLQDTVLVVYLPDCHESLAGIVAGRLREAYHRPAIVLTAGREGIKGSGRSTPSYDMYKELARCRDLFAKFGGHPMAAGMSLRQPADGEDVIEVLRRRLNEHSPLTADDLYERVEIDMPLPPSRMTKELITELQRLEPCGKGNTRPLFAWKNLRPARLSVRGKNDNVLKCSLQDEAGQWYTGVYFGEAKEAMAYISKKEQIDIVYDGRINEYMGRKSVELRILYYR